MVQRRNEALCKLFIGGLKKDTAEEDFREYFSKYGVMTDSVIICDKARISRGFGFVTYENPDNVDAVLLSRPHFIDNKEVEIRRATPKHLAAQGNTAQSRSPKVFLGGLHADTTEDEIREYFDNKYRNLGLVKEVDIKRDSNGSSRGFGFVIFENEDVTDKLLLEESEIIIHGKKILPKPALPKMKDQDNIPHRRAPTGGPVGHGRDYDYNRSSRPEPYGYNDPPPRRERRQHDRSDYRDMDYDNRDYYDRRGGNNYESRGHDGVSGSRNDYGYDSRGPSRHMGGGPLPYDDVPPSRFERSNPGPYGGGGPPRGSRPISGGIPPPRMVNHMDRRSPNSYHSKHDGPVIGGGGNVGPSYMDDYPPPVMNSRGPRPPMDGPPGYVQGNPRDHRYPPPSQGEPHINHQSGPPGGGRGPPPGGPRGMPFNNSRPQQPGAIMQPNFNGRLSGGPGGHHAPLPPYSANNTGGGRPPTNSRSVRPN